MRKAMLSLLLFLAVCLSANAQDYRVERVVVGTGGFVGVSAGQYKVSGVAGQTAIGKFTGSGQTGGNTFTMYNGFWVPGDKPTSIDDGNGFTARALSSYPNPVRTSATFKFDLETSAHATLRVYSLTGTLIATIIDELRDSGTQTAEWNLRNTFGEEIASGSYMCELVVMPMGAGNNSNIYTLKDVMMVAR